MELSESPRCRSADSLFQARIRTRQRDLFSNAVYIRGFFIPIRPFRRGWQYFEAASDTTFSPLSHALYTAQYFYTNFTSFDDFPRPDARPH